MAGRRLIYQNWRVEEGRDGAEFDWGKLFDRWLGEGEDATGTATGAVPDGRAGRIESAVTEALALLDDSERELIRHIYYSGRTIPELSRETGRAIHRLEGQLVRTLRKLKKSLRPFVRREFGIAGAEHPNCPICRSPLRAAIDQLIASRDRNRTWRPILVTLREQYGLNLRSPQTLVGHEKYH